MPLLHPVISTTDMDPSRFVIVPRAPDRSPVARRFYAMKRQRLMSGKLTVAPGVTERFFAKARDIDASAMRRGLCTSCPSTRALIFLIRGRATPFTDTLPYGERRPFFRPLFQRRRSQRVDLEDVLSAKTFYRPAINIEANRGSVVVFLSRPFFCLALAAARVHLAAKDPLGERLVTGEAHGRRHLAVAGPFVVFLGNARRLLLVDGALKLEETGQGSETHRVLGDIAVQCVDSRPHVLERGDQDFHLLVGESRHESTPGRCPFLRGPELPEVVSPVIRHAHLARSVAPGLQPGAPARLLAPASTASTP